LYPVFGLLSDKRTEFLNKYEVSLVPVAEPCRLSRSGKTQL